MCYSRAAAAAAAAVKAAAACCSPAVPGETRGPVRAHTVGLAGERSGQSGGVSGCGARCTLLSCT